MIEPAPTSRVPRTQARGIFAGTVPATATRPAHIILTILDTSYQLHLLPSGEIRTPVGKRIVGTIRAQARRVDKVSTGGRYVEPVIGRPRRVQGSVVEGDAPARTITVDAGVPIVCTLTDSRQSAAAFGPGDLVSFDVLDGATFTPEA